MRKERIDSLAHLVFGRGDEENRGLAGLVVKFAFFRYNLIGLELLRVVDHSDQVVV